MGKEKLYPGFEKGLAELGEESGGGPWADIDKLDLGPGKFCKVPKMNPKHIQAQKDGKAPLEYLIWSVLEDDAYVHAGGGEKYGVRNWRVDEILASTYEGAMMRHFTAWAQGEDLDPDDGRPHLSHLRACCAIVMDAQAHDKLVDDRDRCESKEGETDGDTSIPAEDGEADAPDAQEGAPGSEEGEEAQRVTHRP